MKCKVCGKEFEPKVKWQKFCSSKCHAKNANIVQMLYHREYRLLHREERRFEAKIRKIFHKFQIFQLLGNKCARCGENDWKVLQVDHVNGGGTKERISKKAMGNRAYKFIFDEIKRDSKKYQLLCANCNWKKRYENDGEIYHKKYSDIPSIEEVWEALESGKTHIEWKKGIFPLYFGQGEKYYG